MTLSPDTLRTERNAILDRARGIAAKAESAGRGLTDSEQAEAAQLLTDAEAKNATIRRVEDIAKTTDEVRALMTADPGGHRKTAGQPQRRQARFAKAITSALFGIQVDDSGLMNERRVMFDANGNDTKDLKAVNALNVPAGRTTIPVARRDDNGSIALLPEFGGTLLGLLNYPPLSGSDTYRIRRQTIRDEDAAQFVPKRAKKPEAAFGFEVIEDRVRTLAVLSEPIPTQDLADVPKLVDDLGHELATRIIWRLEDAIIRGEQTDEDDAGREMFNGILHTEGVREQAYVNSPFRTIRRSLTVLEASGYDPEALAIVLNPMTWEALETEVDSDGRPLFSGLYSARQEPVLFGRPVVLSNRLGESEAIVADWRQGMVTLRGNLDLSWSDGGQVPGSGVALCSFAEG